MPPTRARRVAEIAVLAVLYYAAARVGLHFSLVEQSVTPLWPASGIAVAALYLFGPAVWPGVALAALAANLPISPSIPAAVAIAIGDTTAPVLAAILLRRLGFRTRMDRVSDAVVMVLVAGFLCMLVSASIGAETLVASGVIPASGYWDAWWVWWTGDAVGVMVVAPFLFSLLHLRERPKLSWGNRLEIALVLAAVTLVSYGAVYTGLQLKFVVLPILGWAAWRYPQRAPAPAAVLVSGIATWGATHGSKLFATGPLVERMATLHVFNATVAFTAIAFSALVMERARDREALQRSATQLEERVRRRTEELSLANSHLVREVVERKEAEHQLRLSERQLAEAQRMARMGSWEWSIADNEVRWSDEMFRIYDREPQEGPISFDVAVESILPEDLERIRLHVEEALRRGTAHDLPSSEYRIRTPNGAVRELRGMARVTFDRTGKPLRMLGTVQDITEDKRAEREHVIAETLQRSLLPERLPEIPGVSLAARYVAAGTEMEVGGDWYDVVQLAGGRVGVAIGDVAGHGLAATSTMGQLRLAVRAYALEAHSPVDVLKRLDRLARTLALPEMATLVYLVFDPDSGSIVYANAGHLPPLLLGPDGEGSYLEEALGPPLGAAGHPDQYAEAAASMHDGSLLLLFTDGLIERRAGSLRDGLDRLLTLARTEKRGVEALCDALLASLPEDRVADDIALLAVQSVSFDGRPLEVRLPAEPRVLAPLRSAIRRWLRQVDASRDEIDEILVACGEACANAIVHAYGGQEGELSLELSMRDDEIVMTVRDTGRWREQGRREGGRGLKLIEGLMDSVDIQTGPDGTWIRMRRRLRDRIPT